MASTMRGDLAVDHHSPVPLYHQIAEKIRSGVEAGKLPLGGSLGSEKRLADELGVSLPTVRRAFHILAAEGIVTRKPGVGTFLSGPAPRNLIRVVAVGQPSCRLASLEKVIPGSGVTKLMALNDDSSLWRLVRISLQGDTPTGVLENFLLNEPTASDRMRFAGSGSDVALMSSMTNGRSVHYEINALEAAGWLAQELGIRPGTPLMVLEQTVHSGDGKPVEFARHSYLASHHRFEANFSPSCR